MAYFSPKKEILYDTVLQRKHDMLFNEIDGEVVMLSVENSEYYGMDKVGSRIWELIEQPLTLKSIVTKLMEEYNVTEQQCHKDTLSFLNKLLEKRLIIIK
jgi:hypothetical protein